MDKKLLGLVLTLVLVTALLVLRLYLFGEMFFFVTNHGNPEGLPILSLIVPYIEAGFMAVFHFFASMFIHKWYGLYVITGIAAAFLYLCYARPPWHIRNGWKKPEGWSYKLPPPNRVFITGSGLVFGSYLIFAPFWLFPVGKGLLVIDLIFQAKEAGNFESSMVGRIFYSFFFVHEVMFWSGAATLLLIIPSCAFWVYSKLKARREELCF